MWANFGKTVENEENEGAKKPLSKCMAWTAECMVVVFTELGDIEGATDLRSF